MATNKGYRVFISPVAVGDTDLDQSEFEAIDDWEEISNVGTLPERGRSENEATYNTLAHGIVKGKGSVNYGSGELECRRLNDDAGQLALIDAAKTESNYAIKMEAPDGTGEDVGDMSPTTEYLRCLISGPTRPSGGDEDFPLRTFSLYVNQWLEVASAEIQA